MSNVDYKLVVDVHCKAKGCNVIMSWFISVANVTICALLRNCMLNPLAHPHYLETYPNSYLLDFLDDMGISCVFNVEI